MPIAHVTDNQVGRLARHLLSACGDFLRMSIAAVRELLILCVFVLAVRLRCCRTRTDRLPRIVLRPVRSSMFALTAQMMRMRRNHFRDAAPALCRGGGAQRCATDTFVLTPSLLNAICPAATAVPRKLRCSRSSSSTFLDEVVVPFRHHRAANLIENHRSNPPSMPCLLYAEPVLRLSPDLTKFGIPIGPFSSQSRAKPPMLDALTRNFGAKRRCVDEI